MSVTVLIDGTDVQSSKRTMVSAEGVIDTPEFRGDNLVFPYAHGETPVPKYLAAKPVVLFMAIDGDDEDDLKAEIAALFALLPILPASPGDAIDTTCTLTRRIVTGSGTTNTDGAAEYIGGAEPNFFGDKHARLTLRFKLLNGYWG